MIPESPRRLETHIANHADKWLLVSVHNFMFLDSSSREESLGTLRTLERLHTRMEPLVPGTTVWSRKCGFANTAFIDLI